MLSKSRKDNGALEKTKSEIKSPRISAKEIAAHAILGAMTFTTKFAMEGIPSVHLLALFIAAETIAFGKKALFPIYVYVILDGIRAGFAFWWIPYLYIWAIGFAMFALADKLTAARGVKLRTAAFMITAGMFGISFGALYAPAQMIIYHMSFKGIIAWQLAGFFTFDIPHGVSNFIACSAAIPFAKLIKKASRI